MRRWLEDWAAVIAAFIVAAILIGGAVWFNAAAPCSWFGLTPQREIPGRCLTNIK